MPSPLAWATLGAAAAGNRRRKKSPLGCFVRFILFVAFGIPAIFLTMYVMWLVFLMVAGQKPY